MGLDAHARSPARARREPMTQNEAVQIARIMGWDDELEYSSELNALEYFDDLPEKERLWLAKLLQAKMVADRWNIVIAQHPPDCFSATAWKDIFEGKKYITEIEHYAQRVNTEPAALHALFVKVYNIGGE